MADRRMFSKTIVLSDSFLDMPHSARSLYFMLGMVADDSGMVGSPKSTMRMCGASEDDLRILISKRFIIAFESGVIVIKHWHINNYLQKDRIKQTTYIKELSMIQKDVNNSYTDRIQTVSIMDSQLVENNKNNIISIVEEEYNAYPSADSIDSIISEIISTWNSLELKKTRIDKIPFGQKRYNDTFLLVNQYGMETVINAIKSVDEQAFFRKWHPSYDWVVNPNNFIKLIEGNYKTDMESDWKKAEEERKKKEWDEL